MTAEMHKLFDGLMSTADFLRKQIDERAEQLYRLRDEEAGFSIKLGFHDDSIFLGGYSEAQSAIRHCVVVQLEQILQSLQDEYAKMAARILDVLEPQPESAHIIPNNPQARAVVLGALARCEGESE